MWNKIEKFKSGRFFKFIARHKYPILLILIAVITHWQWFDPGSLLFHGDWRHWPDENIQRFVGGGYGAYIDDLNFGVQNIQIYFSFIFSLWGMIGSYLGAIKLVLLVPIALLALLAPYYLAKELIKDERVALAAALFYGFSTVLLKLELAHLFIAFVFALAPLIILSFIRLFNHCSGKNIIIFSLIYSLGCFYELRIMYIVTFIIFFYFLIQVTREKLKTAGLKYLLVIFLILAFNAFWLLPTIFSDHSVLSSVQDRGLFGNNFFNIFYAISSYDKYWNGQELIPFKAQPIPAWAWLAPIFSLALFFSFKKANKADRKIFLFSLFLVLLGILLGKQSSAPWPNLYEWLYEHFPGFSLFREASKFFLLTILGYLMLFAFALKYLVVNNKRLNKHFKSAVILGFCLFFLLPAKPLITGEAGWLFSAKTEPAEYKILNQAIKSSGDFFRTLWVPRDSQWGYYNWDRPKVSLVAVKESGYKSFYSDHEGEKNYAAFILEPFEKNYGDYLADLSNIKYFIVPMPDKQSNPFEYYGSDYQDYVGKTHHLNFLQELKIPGLNKIKVYENKNYLPYIFPLDDLFAFSSELNLEGKYDLIKNYLNKDFNFTVVGNDGKNTDNLINLENLFENIRLPDIKQAKLVFAADRLISQKTNYIYANQVKNKLYAQEIHSKISFYTRTAGSLELNGRRISPEQKNILEQIAVPDSDEYYLVINDKLVPLTPNQEVYLGPFDRSRSPSLFSPAGQNLIPNPSFEDGLWQDKVKDCHHYDDNPIISSQLNAQDKTQGNYALQLEAARHLACTSRDFSVKPDADYLFSFDYKSLAGQKVGYYLKFDDQDKTVITENFMNHEPSWQTYRKKIIIPPTAARAKLFLYAYESDRISNNINLYDNLRFSRLDKIKEGELTSQGPEYSRQELALAEEENIFTYSAGDLTYQNIINNPSFESGLWQDKVKDCHHYDDNPIIAMNLNSQQKSTGNNSLQLEAVRHLACTSISFPIGEGATYYFGFDYQSPNAERAGYYLSFNDQKKDFLSGQIKINTSDWQNFSQVIKAPAGASQANLYIYAYPTNNQKNNIVRYDNFQLREIPDLADKYYLVSQPKLKLQKPGQIEFKTVSPTKKEIHVKSAATPFFLALNESFNQYWRLEFDGLQNQGLLNSWWPLAKPAMITEKNHYRLDNFLNVWYVDINGFCRDNSACSKNLDGSYDLKMTVEFWPQRWFYLGRVISLLVFLSAILFYLTYYHLNAKNKA